MNFENLTPLYPEERLKMEYLDPTKKEECDASGDRNVSPQARASATLIVAPPRTGKTVMLQNIAHSITANHPEVLSDCAADRRAPRRSDGYGRTVKGEVVSSTFDEPAPAMCSSLKW
jgi:transcription termination factor Rho